jgi:hypothetical protein
VRRRSRRRRTVFKWLLQKDNMIMDIKFAVYLRVTPHRSAIRYCTRVSEELFSISARFFFSP